MPFRWLTLLFSSQRITFSPTSFILDYVPNVFNLEDTNLEYSSILKSSDVETVAAISIEKLTLFRDINASESKKTKFSLHFTSKYTAESEERLKSQICAALMCIAPVELLTHL